MRFTVFKGRLLDNTVLSRSQHGIRIHVPLGFHLDCIPHVLWEVEQII